MATPASLRAFEMWTTRYKRMWRSGLTTSLLSPACSSPPWVSASAAW
jgi:hypothetical protein